MLHQPRILSREETLLRDGSRAANLASNPGQWFSLTPGFDDERYEISGVSISIAGPGLLSALDGFAGTAGTIEFGIDGYDGYGALRDLAALVPQVLNSAEEWNRGAHTRTVADGEAGQQRDGSVRVGLRGLPVRSSGAAQQPVWTSVPIDLRYGQELVALSWDCWTLRDPSGNTVGAPRIEVRTGTRGAGGLLAWNTAFQVVASAPNEIDQGYVNLAAPLAGNVYQLRLTLPYVDPTAAVTPSDSVLQTAVFFAICGWVKLTAPRWRFASMAEVLERSELVRTLAPASWTGGDDLALLRIPLNFALRGRFGETIRARVSSPTTLTLLEISPMIDPRFETTAR